MNLKRKLNLLEKLKEEQDTKEQKLRFSVKTRWNRNTGYSFCRELCDSLSTSNQNKFTKLILKKISLEKGRDCITYLQ